MKTCPVPGCGAPCRQAHLTCRECWRRVPKREQAEVNQSWLVFQRRSRERADSESLLAATARYRAAADTAIKSAEAAR